LGDSFVDVVIPFSRDSFANITGMNLDSKEIKSRLYNTCIDNSSVKTSHVRHDYIEKHLDLPKQKMKWNATH
jgi:hypothetical protein